MKPTTKTPSTKILSVTVGHHEFRCKQSEKDGELIRSEWVSKNKETISDEQAMIIYLLEEEEREREEVRDKLIEELWG